MSMFTSAPRRHPRSARARRPPVGPRCLGGGAAQAPAGTGHHPVRVAIVVVNGRVFTGDERRAPLQAVAVGADGRILDGRDDGRRTPSPAAGRSVVDAAGGTVMSGIQDGHMHPLGAAVLSMRPSLGNAR